MKSSYVQQIERFNKKNMPFVELATKDDDLKIFYYDQLFEALGMHFVDSIIDVEPFEDFVEGNLGGVMRFLGQPAMSEQYQGIRVNNEKRTTTDGVYVKRKLRMRWILDLPKTWWRKKSRRAGITTTNQKIHQTIDGIEFDSKKVLKPSTQELDQLRMQIRGSSKILAEKCSIDYGKPHVHG